MALLDDLWAALGGPPALTAKVIQSGPEVALSSRYAVTELAAASIGAATLAVAELAAARSGTDVPEVHVDRAHAAVAFRCEAHQRPDGWALPPTWDPLAGDYPCADGWVRLHTNYAHHRDAALAALGVPATRDALAAAVAGRSGAAIEDAVVARGGCAAALRDPEVWAASEPGRAVAAEPLVAWSASGGGAAWSPGPAERPLSGVRVLDLTRVLAGPVATRLLAAWGAEVLRVDPPGFEEVGALVPEMHAGKRCAIDDLRDPAALARAARGADVLVTSLRPGASVPGETASLRALQPGLTVVRHAAWGWTGPWRARRGFDSLVQMATGIAWGAERPTPLPAQALDHATGYLMAAAACRALTERLRDGAPREARLSLARTAAALPPAPAAPAEPASPERYLERAETAWGPVDRVRVPGQIGDLRPRLDRPAAPARPGAGWDAA